MLALSASPPSCDLSRLCAAVCDTVVAVAALVRRSTMGPLPPGLPHRTSAPPIQHAAPGWNARLERMGRCPAQARSDGGALLERMGRSRQYRHPPRKDGRNVQWMKCPPVKDGRGPSCQGWLGRCPPAQERVMILCCRRVGRVATLCHCIFC